MRAVGEDELAAQSVGINLTAVKVSAFTIGGFIAGIGGAIYAHYTTHIEHLNFGVLLATFAIAYPILGGLRSVVGTLLAVLFIQGVLVEGLRFLGDWRNLLFGAFIVLAMNLRPFRLHRRAGHPGARAAVPGGARKCLSCAVCPSISAACGRSTSWISRWNGARSSG